MRGGTTPNPLIQRANGSELKAPRRRAVVSVKRLGPPRNCLQSAHKRQWDLFARELPWLAESDRPMVELASALRAEFVEKGSDMLPSKLNLLRQVLAALGANPIDRNRIHVLPSDDDEGHKSDFFS